MRPRASQVARIRLVETEEDVENVCRCTGLTPLTLAGGRCKEQGVGSIFYLPQVKLFIFRYLHSQGEVGEVETGLIILYARQFRSCHQLLDSFSGILYVHIHTPDTPMHM